MVQNWTDGSHELTLSYSYGPYHHVLNWTSSIRDKRYAMLSEHEGTSAYDYARDTRWSTRPALLYIEHV